MEMIVALTMKKFLGILVLGLLFSNLAQGESLLPKCEGNDEKISSFSVQIVMELRSVQKVQNMLVNFIKENFTGRELLPE